MELLQNLYEIHSMSGQENAMRKFIKKYVRNMEGVKCTQKDGNLYIVKGEEDTYPCIIAHLDQVQTKHSPDFKVFRHDDVLFAYSAQNGRQEGLGADDKNGIWVALKCLEYFPAIKVAFFKEEEVGCLGSEVADMSFFSDVRFVLQADRRNGGDLITDISGRICSDEFLDDIDEIRKAHGYEETTGLMTDVETLADKGVGVSCINFSCGYYKPHTDEEYTSISELLNCLEFAMEIIGKCTKVYTFKREKKTYFGGFGSYGGYGSKCYYGGASHSLSAVGDAYLKACKDDDESFVNVVDFKDYPTPEDAVWAFLESNLDLVNNVYDLYELWDYISSDADTYGFTYEEYCDMVESLWLYREEESYFED